MGIKLTDKDRNNMDYEQLKINLEKVAPSQKDFDDIIELMDFVYYLGMDDGESSGYNNALDENEYDDMDDRIDEARDIAYDEGYRDSRNEAEYEIESASENGYSEGHIDGVSKGKESGYNEGYEIGYDEGYDNGVNSIS